MKCLCWGAKILYIKLMKGKALRKHSLHEKTAAILGETYMISKSFSADKGPVKGFCDRIMES